MRLRVALLTLALLTAPVAVGAASHPTLTGAECRSIAVGRTSGVILSATATQITLEHGGFADTYRLAPTTLVTLDGHPTLPQHTMGHRATIVSLSFGPSSPPVAVVIDARGVVR